MYRSISVLKKKFTRVSKKVDLGWIHGIFRKWDMPDKVDVDIYNFWHSIEDPTSFAGHIKALMAYVNKHEKREQMIKSFHEVLDYFIEEMRKERKRQACNKDRRERRKRCLGSCIKWYGESVNETI